MYKNTPELHEDTPLVRTSCMQGLSYRDVYKITQNFNQDTMHGPSYKMKCTLNSNLKS